MSAALSNHIVLTEESIFQSTTNKIKEDGKEQNLSNPEFWILNKGESKQKIKYKL